MLSPLPPLSFSLAGSADGASDNDEGAEKATGKEVEQSERGKMTLCVNDTVTVIEREESFRAWAKRMGSNSTLFWLAVLAVSGIFVHQPLHHLIASPQAADTHQRSDLTTSLLLLNSRHKWVSTHNGLTRDMRSCIL